MRPSTGLQNPHHDERDANTLRVALGVLIFVLVIGTFAVFLLHATVP